MASSSTPPSPDEDWDCPLCMEEMDISDRHFKPCTCGYQICRFCWNHIRQSLNGQCPACRRLYSEQMVEFTPLTNEEYLISNKIKTSKQQQGIKKERERKEASSQVTASAVSAEANSRKHLYNLRVIQKNLVYVIGLSKRVASEEILKKPEYFGQFGKILKIVVNKKQVYHQQANHGPSVSVYVTFYKNEDAARTIQAIDGTLFDGKILRASFGTTKYCSYFLRNMPCPNPGCMYLHEQGDATDSFTKEEMAQGFEEVRQKPTQRLGLLPSAEEEPVDASLLITVKAAEALMREKGLETKDDSALAPAKQHVRRTSLSLQNSPALKKEAIEDEEFDHEDEKTTPEEKDPFDRKLSFDPFQEPCIRHKSRFDFAQNGSEIEEGFQNDLRALLPHVNISFSDRSVDESTVISQMLSTEIQSANLFFKQFLHGGARNSLFSSWKSSQPAPLQDPAIVRVGAKNEIPKHQPMQPFFSQVFNRS